MRHNDFSRIRAPAGRPVRSWSAFEAALTIVFRVLDDDLLILQVRGTGRYVQLHVSPGPRVRAEAVCNAYLSGPERLDDTQLAALERLGWNPPQLGTLNFFRDIDPNCPIRVAVTLLVRTLAEVFGARSPKDLEYRAVDGDGIETSFPLLGISQLPSPRISA